MATPAANPYTEAHNQRLRQEDPSYEYSEFDRPHGEDMWSYRVLQIERDMAWIYLHQTDGSQEDEIQRLTLALYHFGGDLERNNEISAATIEDAWTEETKYPDPAYEHMRSSPSGQCAVTNIVFGMLLGSTNLIDRKNIFLAAGVLRAADGTILDKDHRWLHVVGEDNKEWRIDLTSHQSAEKNPDPNGFMRIVMQPVRHKMRPHPLINQPPLSVSEYGNYTFPAADATAIVYNETERTPLEEVNLEELNGRVERLVDRLELNTLGRWMGPQDDRYGFDLRKETGLWYPKTYDFGKEGSGELPSWPDKYVRDNTHEFIADLASNYDLNDEYTQESAEVDAELGVALARRANKAHIAMKMGTLVVTDDYPRSIPYGAKKTFEALQVAAGSFIGRDTLGAYALEHLKKTIL
jgi:hypothetical protein